MAMMHDCADVAVMRQTEAEMGRTHKTVPISPSDAWLGLYCMYEYSTMSCINACIVLLLLTCACWNMKPENEWRALRMRGKEKQVRGCFGRVMNEWRKRVERLAVCTVHSLTQSASQ